MDDAREFVEVRFPAKGLAFGLATRAPGRSADLLVEAAVRSAQEPVFSVRALVHGLGPDELDRLATELAGRYGGSVHADGARLRFGVRHPDLPSKLFGTLLAFQAAFGPAWMHYEARRLVMRARAIDCSAQECAVKMRSALRLASVRTPVKVVHLSDAELRTWHALLAWRDADGGVPMLAPAQRSLPERP